MTILDKIVARKHEEIAERKAVSPAVSLEQSTHFQRPVASLSEHLRQSTQYGIIAEFKRRSPSKGDIRADASAVAITMGYVQAGAAALSILTDEDFFGGQSADLTAARGVNSCPILRKDFIIDEYQVLEARAIGADAILLIAECLSKAQVRQLAQQAQRLGMEVLMEVHSAEQLDKLCPEIDVVGVNNRNLKDFSVSLATSLALAELIPIEMVKISESGIEDPNAIVELRRRGFRGFLIGEHFMRSPDPGEACRGLIERVGYIENLYDGGIADVGHNNQPII